MRQGSIPGLILVVLGIVLSFVPHYIMPVCQHGIQLASGDVAPMRCFYTGQMEMACGVALAVLGVFVLLARSVPMRRGLGLAGLLLSLLILAVPTVLIGVCPGEAMPCHAGTYPAVMVLGVVSALVCLLCCVRTARG